MHWQEIYSITAALLGLAVSMPQILNLERPFLHKMRSRVTVMHAVYFLARCQNAIDSQLLKYVSRCNATWLKGYMLGKYCACCFHACVTIYAFTLNGFSSWRWISWHGHGKMKDNCWNKTMYWVHCDNVWYYYKKHINESMRCIAHSIIILGISCRLVKTTCKSHLTRYIACVSQQNRNGGACIVN